jgi:hypothetical protein
MDRVLVAGLHPLTKAYVWTALTFAGNREDAPDATIPHLLICWKPERGLLKAGFLGAVET